MTGRGVPSATPGLKSRGYILGMWGSLARILAGTCVGWRARRDSSLGPNGPMTWSPAGEPGGIDLRILARPPRLERGTPGLEGGSSDRLCQGGYNRGDREADLGLDCAVNRGVWPGV